MKLIHRPLVQRLAGGACLALSLSSALSLALSLSSASALSNDNQAAWTRRQSLLGSILLTNNATATFSAYAGSRGWDTQIRVHKLVADLRRPPADVARQLEVAEDATVGYRRIEMVSGDHVLLRADNWYVPARLASGVNAGLNVTETPFGKLVEPLSPMRQVVRSKRLWTSQSDPMPAEILQLDAVVTGTFEGGRAPLAVVHEVYLATAIK